MNKQHAIHKIQQDVKFYLKIPAELRKDKDILKAAYASKNIRAIRYGEFRLPRCDDLDCMMEAVQVNPGMISFASPKLRANKALISEVVRNANEQGKLEVLVFLKI